MTRYLCDSLWLPTHHIKSKRNAGPSTTQLVYRNFEIKWHQRPSYSREIKAKNIEKGRIQKPLPFVVRNKKDQASIRHTQKTGTHCTNVFFLNLRFTKVPSNEFRCFKSATTNTRIQFPDRGAHAKKTQGGGKRVDVRPNLGQRNKKKMTCSLSPS